LYKQGRENASKQKQWATQQREKLILVSRFYAQSVFSNLNPSLFDDKPSSEMEEADRWCFTIPAVDPLTITGPLLEARLWSDRLLVEVSATELSESYDADDSDRIISSIVADTRKLDEFGVVSLSKRTRKGQPSSSTPSRTSTTADAASKDEKQAVA